MSVRSNQPDHADLPKQSPVEAEKFIRQIAELYEHESLVALHLEARTKTTPQETAEWFDSLRDLIHLHRTMHRKSPARGQHQIP